MTIKEEIIQTVKDILKEFETEDITDDDIDLYEKTNIYS